MKGLSPEGGAWHEGSVPMVAASHWKHAFDGQVLNGMTYNLDK